MASDNDDILNMVDEQRRKADTLNMKGLIIQPGAIGDCVLTLPLACAMKAKLGLGSVEILGHTEYIGFFPSRTCVDKVRSIDCLGLNRLFVDSDSFVVEDGDVLINAFAGYDWIVSFLGGEESDFEKNLVFTVHCIRNSEVISLALRPPENYGGHVLDFYGERMNAQTLIDISRKICDRKRQFIRATESDVLRGKEILFEAGIAEGSRVAVMQPGSGGRHKCWALENFSTVARRLREAGMETIFLIGPAERERLTGREISSIASAGVVIEGQSLLGAVCLLANASCYIGNDSGLGHIAGAMGVDTYVIFGPTNPAVYEPCGTRVRIFRGESGDFTGEFDKGTVEKLISAILG